MPRHARQPCTRPRIVEQQGTQLLYTGQAGSGRSLGGKRSWLHSFSAWDFNGKRARRVGREIVLGSGHQIEAWNVGEFDGNIGNGDELVIVPTDLRDRSIGYQHWSMETGVKKGGATILPATAIAPQVSAGRVFTRGRYDWWSSLGDYRRRLS